MKKIVVVGQTPPPYGGQALMIKYMLDSNYEGIKFYHVRMAFSRSFHDRGKFSFYKILHLIRIILSIWKIKIIHNPSIIYYPPSSSPKVAVLRDVIILGCTRFLFSKTIFHFHAAGLSEELPNYKEPLRCFAYNILRRPDIAITSSEFNPKDGEFLRAKKIKILPLGIPDLNKNHERIYNIGNRDLNVLFVGLLNSTKGEEHILDALKILSNDNIHFHFYIAGKFQSEEYKERFFSKILEYNLKDYVHYKGVVSGNDKKNLYLSCDILCFPSFFSSESFGMVLLEGMMYQMPLIATKWRGIQSIVRDGQNGYLVDIKNSMQIADRLKLFHTHRNLLRQMGECGRKIFEQEYTIDRYTNKLGNIFNEI